MKVIYFHQYFSTPKGSTGTRSYTLAKKLIEKNHEVLIVCINDIRCETQLTTNFVRNRRRGFTDGIEILEFNFNYSNHLSFWERALIFIKYSLYSVSVVLKEDFDLIFCTSTPLTSGIPGIAAKLLRKKPFVFEIRDLWPEIPIALGIVKNKFLIYILKLLEKTTYFTADACIGLAPGICEGINKCGISKSKIFLIPNFSDEKISFSNREPISNYRYELPKVFNKKNKNLIAAFTGAHGICNNLESIIEAAKILKKLKQKNIYIVFIGDGMVKKNIKLIAQKHKLNNCIFIDPIEKVELFKILKNYISIGLMTLKNIPEFYNGTSPNKFFDYINNEVPVLINYPGWIADLLTQYNAGIFVNPEKPKELANALIDLYNSKNKLETYSINAKKLSNKKFLAEDLSQKWTEILIRIYEEKNLKNQ